VLTLIKTKVQIMNYETAIAKLFNEIATDYAVWCEKMDYSSNKENPAKEMIDQLSISNGRKYDRIVRNRNQRCVWGFIVKEDTEKFKKGDILLAASWASPATNKARGNIFEEYNISWTQPNYLF